MRALKANEDLVRSQHGADLLIRLHAPALRTAQVRGSEREPWRPATYEDLLDFIIGRSQPAPAEEPREVVEPAPAPAQRFVCLKCGWHGPQSDTYMYPAPNSGRYHMGCPYAVVPVREAGS